MIRPFRAEVERYGPYSVAGEFLYDFPFQWGSKRTGPDLHRVGGKYPNLWHFTHLMDPRATSPGSNMPAFTWLTWDTVKPKDAPRKLALMRKLGVPYSDQELASAEAWQRTQADAVAADLATQGIQVNPESEMVAIISYLQRLGRGPQFPMPAGGLKTASAATGGSH